MPDHDADRDRDDRHSKSKSAPASSKTKDLSHVPCKFFKVGGCTAGASCPFSHSAAEPGGQKETCTWFVKGNCKFGHKCALAHILPGQSPAMDRKNKKAAQAAAALAAGNNAPPGGAGEREREKERAKGVPARSKRDPGAGSPGAARLPLLAGGATAPTRSVGGAGSGSGGRPPLGVPLKASISPSAPAPPLKDTDFAAFATLDDMDDLHKRASSRASTDQDGAADEQHSTYQTAEEGTIGTTTTSSNAAAPVSLPPSAPRSSATPTTPMDFGPIGSPPTYRSAAAAQPTSPTRANGGAAAFSPGTSPRHATHINGVNINHGPAHHTPHAAAAASGPAGGGAASPGRGLLSSSPFSAPGTQSVFGSYGASGGGGGFGALGMAASLGSGLAMMGGGARKAWGDSSEVGSVGAAGQPNSFGGLLSAQLSASRPVNGYAGRSGEYDISVEYEDFGGGREGGRRGAGAGYLRGREMAVEDEEMEDFLPSSLTELLTPEERSRRMSRSHSGQPPPMAMGGGISQLSRELAGERELGAGNGGGNNNGNNNNGGGLGHRYSRSVPAPSLLGDIKSIWADTAPNNTANALPASPTRGPYAAARFDPYGGGGNLTANAFADHDAALSMSVGSGVGGGGGSGSYGMMGLSPSNASGAFLPGLHHHYMSAKAKAAAQQQAQQQQVQQQQQQQQQVQQQQAGLGLGLGGIGRQLRGASQPLYAAPPQQAQGNGGALAGNYPGGGGLGLGLGVPPAAGFHTHTHGGTQTTYRTPSSPFDLTQAMHQQPQQQAQQQQQPAGRLAGYGAYGGGGVTAGAGAGVGQGQQQQQQGAEEALLAPHLLSPSARALQAHAPGQSLPQGLAAGYSRIHALPPLTHLALSPPAGGEDGFSGAAANAGGAQAEWGAGQGTPGSAGLEGMFSRLSYSAAAARGGAGPRTPPPPGLTRGASAGRYVSGPLSPLSGPVVTNDDDLFDMDK